MRAAALRLRRLLARHLLVYLALLLLAVTGVGAALARESIAIVWRALPPWTVPSVVALSLVNYLLRFVRWQLLLAQLGAKVPSGGGAKIWFACLSMVVTPARLGELAKLGLLRTRYAVPVRHSAAALVVDRVADALALLLLAAGGLAASARRFELPAVLLLAAATLLYAATAPAPRRAVVRQLRRWRATQRRADALEELLSSNARLLSPASLAPTLGLSLLAWWAECIGLYCIAVGVGAPIPWTAATWIYSASTLAGNLTFIPGGLVGTEVSLVALLRQHQMPHDLAFGAAALVRAATLWFAVVVGGFVTIWFRRTLRFGALDEWDSEAAAAPDAPITPPK